MSTLSPTQKMSRAKLEATREFPFFGLLILACEFLEDEGASTLWSDGRRIGYNPDFVARCEGPELVWLIAHEALHNAFGHGFRMGARDTELHNIATDFWINGVLYSELHRHPTSRMSLPNLPRITGNPEAHMALDPGRFGILSSDAIYAELVRESLERPDTGGGAGQERGEDEGGGGSGKSPFEQYDQAGLNGDLRPEKSKSGSSAEQDATREFWRAMLARAFDAAGELSGLSDALKRTLEDAIAGQVPWQDALSRFVQPSPADFVWEQPDRRFVEEDFILPDVAGSTLEVVLCLDTSGSIPNEALSYFLRESSSILRSFDRVRGFLIACDEQITLIRDIEEEDFDLESLKGGRGTSFAPPFAWLEHEGIRPHALVYFTDGLGDFPAQEPDYPVLWLMVNSDVRPNFGEVLRVKLQ